MSNRKTPKAAARGLTLTEGRQLALVRSRPDLPKIMALRLRLLDRLESDFDWIYEQLKEGIREATKDTEPRTRLIIRLLDSLLPAQREIVQQPDQAAAPTGGTTIKIYNVNRGTEQARQEAIEVKTERQRVANRAA